MNSKDKYYQFFNCLRFYAPDEFFNSKPFRQRKAPLKVMLKNITNENDTKIDCLEIKKIQNFTLPFISNQNVFFYLSCVKIENVSQFVLNVHFTLFNHLDIDAFLLPSKVDKKSTEFLVRCKSKKKSLIGPSSLQGTFTFYVEGYRKCKEVNLMNQTTTIFRLISKQSNQSDYLIQLDVIKENEGFCGHLSYPTFPSPIVITNMINSAICVEQKTDSSKSQPFIEHNHINENIVVLTIVDDRISFTVLFSIDIQPHRIKNTNYFYEIRTTKRGDKMILVTENNENTNENQSHFVEKYSINVHFAKIEISFIDKFMRELCLLIIKNINYRVEKGNSILLTVESFRLNDMYVVSKSPVVLCEKSPRFLLFEVKSKLPLKKHSYESIMIDISPLHAFIDPVFASDLIYAINEVIMDSKITKESQQNEIKRENHSIEKFSRHSFYSVKKINISPISIDCLKINSIRTNRLPRPEKFSTFLLFGKYLFLPISLNKCFDEYKCNNIRAPLNNFLKSLAEVYMNQISFSFSDYFKVLKDSSLIKVSSEKFIDIIENQDENDLKRYKKKALIVSPERIPRAFPMNRISSVLNDENRKITCQYSLSQFYFQIDDDESK